MLTRYEASRLKFCQRQQELLAKRHEAKLARSLAAADETSSAQAEYDANAQELLALLAKRDAL